MSAFVIESRSHWEDVYSRKNETEVSWFQPEPEISLALIEASAPEKSCAIVDIGAGASRLVDRLIAREYSDLSVLDISEAALEKAKARLGARAKNVSWIVADVTQWQPPRRWDIWHDRAVFHFLTRREDQDAYIRALKEGTASDATVIISTFALDGPEKCSGLPVHRYSADTLAARLAPGFELAEGRLEIHHTPGGSLQKFIYARFVKTKEN